MAKDLQRVPPIVSRYKAKVDERIKFKLAQFNQLKSLGDDVKQEFRSLINDYQTQLANFHILARSANAIIPILLPLLSLISLFCSIYVFIEKFNIFSINIISIILLFFSTILILIVLTCLALLPGLLKINSASIDSIWTILLILVCLSISYVYFMSTNRPFKIITYSLIIAMLTEGIFWIGFYTALTLMVLFRMIIKRWYLVHYPLAILVDRLILILHDAEEHPGKSINLDYRQQQISRLEEAAKAIGHYIPHQIQCRDTFTFLWLRKVSHQMATALRAKKRWILMPTENTHEDFIDHIADTLTDVLNGNWDALQKMDLEKLLKDEELTHPQVWGSRIISLSKAILVALLPIGLFLGIHQYSPILIPSIYSYSVIIGLLIWATLIIGRELDSDLSSKIGMFKDITSVLPSETDKKSKGG